MLARMRNGQGLKEDGVADFCSLRARLVRVRDGVDAVRSARAALQTGGRQLQGSLRPGRDNYLLRNIGKRVRR